LKCLENLLSVLVAEEIKIGNTDLISIET